jgi:hypothetical protein
MSIFKAKITDVQLDKGKKIAIVGVEVSEGERNWKKAFQIDATQFVNFEAFREKLVQQVIQDLKAETELDYNVSELTSRKGTDFNIEVEVKISKETSDNKVELPEL